MQRRRPEPLYHSFNCCNCRPIHRRECSSTCSAAEEETRANAMSLSSREAGLLVCRVSMSIAGLGRHALRP